MSAFGLTINLGFPDGQPLSAAAMEQIRELIELACAVTTPGSDTTISRPGDGDFAPDVLDIMRRWEEHSPWARPLRQQVITAIAAVPCAFSAPRSRTRRGNHGKAYLNIHPLIEDAPDRSAGYLNTRNVTFSNARHLVDTTSPLVNDEGNYPVIEFHQPGGIELITTVLAAWREECAARRGREL